MSNPELKFSCHTFEIVENSLSDILINDITLIIISYIGYSFDNAFKGKDIILNDNLDIVSHSKINWQGVGIDLIWISGKIMTGLPGAC